MQQILVQAKNCTKQTETQACSKHARQIAYRYVPTIPRIIQDLCVYLCICLFYFGRENFTRKRTRGIHTYSTGGIENIIMSEKLTAVYFFAKWISQHTSDDPPLNKYCTYNVQIKHCKLEWAILYGPISIPSFSE